LAITATCGTPVGASFNATLANYATPDDLPRVMGLLQTGSSVGAMLGPGLAGYLVTVTGSFAWSFRIDAASFFVLAFAVMALRIDRKPQPQIEGEKIRAMDGVKLIMKNDLVRALVILITMVIVAVSVINIGEVFLVMDELGADTITYGIVAATFAFGSVVGAVSTSVFKVPEKISRANFGCRAGCAFTNHSDLGFRLALDGRCRRLVYRWLLQRWAKRLRNLADHQSHARRNQGSRHGCR
jgi:MFS family permease